MTSDFDDGGWNIPQVIVWIISHDLEKVELYKNKPDLLRLDNLYDGRKYPERPVREPDESSDNWNDRMGAYYVACASIDAEKEAPQKIAKENVLQALRSGKIYALSTEKEGISPTIERRIHRDFWQVNDLNEASRLAFHIPSREVMKLWKNFSEDESEIDKRPSETNALRPAEPPPMLSQPILNSWIMVRHAGWPPNHPKPTEEQDWSAAKEHFQDTKLPRNKLRTARLKLPSESRKRGPRSHK